MSLLEFDIGVDKCQNFKLFFNGVKTITQSKKFYNVNNSNREGKKLKVKDSHKIVDKH